MTGSIVTFDDAIPFMPIESIVAEIEPVQDLHGYDSPWPAGGGKNKQQLIQPSGGRGISFSLNDDGSLHVSGTATSDATFYINGSSYAGNDTPELSAGTYTMFCNNFPTNGSATTRVTFNGKYANGNNPSSSTLLARADGTKNTLTFTATDVYKSALYLFISSGETVNFDLEIQLESGSSATAYAPYSNICPISGWTGLNIWNEPTYDTTAQPKLFVNWQTEAGTVYGGSMTVNEDGSGELIATDKIWTANGTENWSAHNSIASWFYIDGTVDDSYVNNTEADFAISNTYKQRKYSTIANAENGEFGIGIPTGTIHSRIVVKDTRFTTTADFKTYLASNNMQIVYKLATPLTYQFENLEQLTTLIGTNNIWVDTGNVTVTYQSTTSRSEYIVGMIGRAIEVFDENTELPENTSDVLEKTIDVFDEHEVEKIDNPLLKNTIELYDPKEIDESEKPEDTFNDTVDIFD